MYGVDVKHPWAMAGSLSLVAGSLWGPLAMADEIRGPVVTSDGFVLIAVERPGDGSTLRERIATPTEAASIGVCFALMIAAWNKALNLQMLKEAFEGTMRSTAMIMLIILAAVFLNFVLGFMGVTQAILEGIKALGWTPMQTMIVIICCVSSEFPRILEITRNDLSGSCLVESTTTSSGSD